MTLEQLLSPQVMDWYENLNNRLNESNTEMTGEQVLEEFDKWFAKNENIINESLRVNEGRFSKIADDEEKEELGISTSAPTVTGAVEGDEEEDKIESESPIEDKEATEIGMDPKGRVVVSNKGDKYENVFNVVNKLYNNIDKKGMNHAKHTPLYNLDTRKVTDMTALLAFTNLPNADLSTWDTRNVKTMEGLFYKSTFNNKSIKDWNVSNCTEFRNMFMGSKFKYKDAIKGWKTGIVNPETGERARLPYVGASRHEEEEMMQSFWDEKFAEFDYDVKESNTSKYKNFLDFQSFLLNEGKVGDFIKRGIDKVKSIFKSVAVKLNDFFVASLAKGGELLDVVNPLTTFNYINSGRVDGVEVYGDIESELLSQPMTSSYKPKDDEYYTNIKKDSNEYKNYMTFLKMLSDTSNESVINIDYNNIINEERVGLSGESGGVFDAQDIDKNKLVHEIKKQMIFTPKSEGKDFLRPILIWGAPGVGKSSIPKAIVEAWNEAQKSSKTKKALIIAECGEMTPDGFSLPMPLHTKFSDLATYRPQAKALSDELGLTPEDWKGFTLEQSGDSPKLWLPCYKPNPDKKKNAVLKQIANGHIIEYYDKDGEYHVEETCDGGIIMFDEFMRADVQIFNIVMQILLNRAYSGYILGDAWGLIACTNRPFDDDQIQTQMQQISPVAMNRFRAQYNFVPKFEDWRGWAEDNGFDDITMSFLTSETDSNGEYIYWHNVDPDLNKDGHTAHATPRSWAELMRSLRAEMKISGYKKISEIPEEDLKADVFGAIGKTVGQKYLDWIERYRDKVSVTDLFNKSDYILPTPLPNASDLCERILSYVKAHWDVTSLPNEELLINMTNTLRKTYSKAKDNVIGQLHLDIIEYLKCARKFKEYIKLCDEYYPE